MGGGPFVAVAVPIGATLGLFALLVFGMVALHVARRVRNDDGPLFPDIAAPQGDPVRFTERLANGGSLADDAARFAAVAAQSGFDQAYALLTMTSAETTSAAREPSRGRLATLTALDDDDRRLAAFLARTPAGREPEVAQPAPVPEPPRAEGMPDTAAPAPEPLPATPVAPPRRDVATTQDDLLPSRRWRRHHAA